MLSKKIKKNSYLCKIQAEIMKKNIITCLTAIAMLLPAYITTNAATETAENYIVQNQKEVKKEKKAEKKATKDKKGKKKKDKNKENKKEKKEKKKTDAQTGATRRT